MRAFVFTDESLAKRAGQFVWLSVNTELAKNTGFLKKYPVQAYPSFFVISPETETVAYRWMGGATVAQLQKSSTTAGGRFAPAAEISRPRSPARSPLRRREKRRGRVSYRELRPPRKVG